MGRLKARNELMQTREARPDPYQLYPRYDGGIGNGAL